MVACGVNMDVIMVSGALAGAGKRTNRKLQEGRGKVERTGCFRNNKQLLKGALWQERTCLCGEV